MSRLPKGLILVKGMHCPISVHKENAIGSEVYLSCCESPWGHCHTTIFTILEGVWAAKPLGKQQNKCVQAGFSTPRTKEHGRLSCMTKRHDNSKISSQQGHVHHLPPCKLEGIVLGNGFTSSCELHVNFAQLYALPTELHV